MKRSAFTVLHNDVLEGQWWRSNEVETQNTEHTPSLSLALHSLRGKAAAGYLTLCDWNTCSNRLQHTLWSYLYLCLCQRNMGKERENAVTIWLYVFSTESMFLQRHLFWGLSHSWLPWNQSKLFGSVMASVFFPLSLHKSQVFSTCYLPKVALFQGSIVSLMEARWH